MRVLLCILAGWSIMAGLTGCKGMPVDDQIKILNAGIQGVKDTNSGGEVAWESATNLGMEQGSTVLLGAPGKVKAGIRVNPTSETSVSADELLALIKTQAAGLQQQSDVLLRILAHQQGLDPPVLDPASQPASTQPVTE